MQLTFIIYYLTMTHYDTLLLTMTARTCVLAASLLIGFLFCYSIEVLIQSVGGMLSCELFVEGLSANVLSLV